jgi:hypothetical protein
MVEEVYMPISCKGNIFVECEVTIGSRAKIFFSFQLNGDN